MAASEKTNHKASRAKRAAEQMRQLRDATAAMLHRGNGQQALDVLLDVVGNLHANNERLTVRLNSANRARFGRSTEKLTAEELGQLILALGGNEEQAAQENPDLPVPEEIAEQGEQTDDEPKTSRRKRKRRKHRGRTRLDPELPRNVTTIKVPEDERNCIHCGTPMQCIGYTDHERIEFVPASIIVNVERREKLACKAKQCEQDITTAPRKKSQAYERRVGPSLLAHLLEAKCDDALPIYRQQEQLRRLGFNVPLNTLYGYWMHATQMLTPVAEAILSTVLGQPIVGVDDTRLDYLDPEGPKAKQRGHLWCFVGTDSMVAFTFTETWCAEDVEPWLSAIDGFIQCDDYKGYSAVLTDSDGVKRILVPPDKRLGCMMHVRRRFYKALKGGHLGAAVPVKFIKDIYKIEAEAKEQGLTPPQRLELRQLESVPLLDQFDQWVDDNRLILLPKSPMGNAANYAFGQRDFVRRCFTDGRFEIDNGRTEREIREPAIGRKNFLFAGSAQAAGRLATAYTVVLSARHLGIPVRDYLIDILTKLEGGWRARRLGELLPQRWAADHGIVTDQ